MPSQQQMDIDDEGDLRPTPPRARQAPVTGKKKAAGAKAKTTRRTTPRREAYEEEVRAEAPVRRNNPRPAPREATRDLARENVRAGAAVVIGHNGETLTRRRTGTGDKYDLPKHEIPRGWDYQWNPVTVLNQNITEIIVRPDLQMHENGWRPVPAARHPGRWTPQGYEGHIVVDGLRLEERPLELSREAQQEDKQRAKAQIRDRTDALRMTQKALPGANQAVRGHGGPQMGMRMSIDPGLDIPAPQHQLDDGSE